MTRTKDDPLVSLLRDAMNHADDAIQKAKVGEECQIDVEDAMIALKMAYRFAEARRHYQPTR